MPDKDNTLPSSERPGHLTRRQFAGTGASSAGALMLGISGEAVEAAQSAEWRKALVARHKIVLTAVDITAPLSVGNGEFAFTADVTGLQSFPDDYRKGIPLATQSQWGFHTEPSPEGFALEKFPWTNSRVNGRDVPYLYYEQGVSPPELEAAANYLYSTPGRLNLGRIGMVLKDANGAAAKLADLARVHQELDLWTGIITSSFVYDGKEVRVQTCCHPETGQIAVSIESELVASGQLEVRLAFPYGPGAAHKKGPVFAFKGFAGDGADWSQPGAHRTVLTRSGKSRADFARSLDDDRYHAALEWSRGCSLSQVGAHEFLLSGDARTGKIEFTAAFSPRKLPATLPSAAETVRRSRAMWENFWNTGGAIDLSQSKDPRWRELERRIVLSQYLTRIQSAGTLPPQETGLTCNSWYGKFHLEMYYFHAAHFALWGRSPLMERSMGFFSRILPKAQATARRQGYEGARWPKCVGPEGDLKPHELEPFLLWQQPHPIHCAELIYRANPGRATLARYREVVLETARFMASFMAWDEAAKLYRLGPPVADANEDYFRDHDNQWNHTFELSYWRFGLKTAQLWRERLGIARDERTEHILAHFPSLPVRDGVYVTGETATDKTNEIVVACLGILDGDGIDRATMRRTFNKVAGDPKTGGIGWAFPMLAMTAARLGEPERAIEMLLKDASKNRYLANGHNPQFPPTIPVYLPGNGSLLIAAAMMAAGWEGAPARHAPGFPDDGNWVVRSTGLAVVP